jgi:hypothetical protein
MLYHAVRGHVCKLCIYYKHYAIIHHTLLLFFHVRPANQLTIKCVAHNLQPANSYKCTNLTPKSASVVPPEDGRLTPETCRGLRHNKVFVKVKVH